MLGRSLSRVIVTFTIVAGPVGVVVNALSLVARTGAGVAVERSVRER